MAKFPLKQEEVLQLAENVLAGLKDNKATYSKPYFDLAELGAVIDSYRHDAEEKEKAKTAYKLAVVKKQEAFTVMAEKVRSQLRYAEATVDFDDEKLKLLGWSGKREPVALSVPGQPRELKAVGQKDASLVLSWTPPSPAAGGKVSVYNVMRSVNAEPARADAGDEEVD